MLSMHATKTCWVKKFRNRVQIQISDFRLKQNHEQEKRKKKCEAGGFEDVGEGNITRRLHSIFITFNKTGVFSGGSTWFLLLKINTIFKLGNTVGKSGCYKKQHSQKEWEIGLRDAVWWPMSKNAFLEPLVQQSWCQTVCFLQQNRTVTLAKVFLWIRPLHIVILTTKKAVFCFCFNPVF